MDKKEKLFFKQKTNSFFIENRQFYIEVGCAKCTKLNYGIYLYGRKKTEILTYFGENDILFTGSDTKLITKSKKRKLG